MKITVELNLPDQLNSTDLSQFLAWAAKLNALDVNYAAPIQNGHASAAALSAAPAQQISHEEFVVAVEEAKAAMGDGSNPDEVSVENVTPPGSVDVVLSDAPRKPGRPRKNPEVVPAVPVMPTTPGRRGPKTKAEKQAMADAALAAEAAAKKAAEEAEWQAAAPNGTVTNGAATQPNLPLASPPPQVHTPPRQPDLSRFGPGPGEAVTPQAPAMPSAHQAPAMPGVSAAAPAQTAPLVVNGNGQSGATMDELEECYSTLLEKKGQPTANKWLHSSVWPDGTPKKKWFRMQQITPELYEPLLNAMMSELNQ